MTTLTKAMLPDKWARPSVPRIKHYRFLQRSCYRKPTSLANTRSPATFLKKFAANVPDFKASPIFTVEAGKLVFRGGGTFRLEPSILGLDADTLVDGQQVRIDFDSFKVKGGVR